eukprot:scaffold503846_cov38-Prasinocladus_malaysianus.AAC.1
MHRRFISVRHRQQRQAPHAAPGAQEGLPFCSVLDSFRVKHTIGTRGSPGGQACQGDDGLSLEGCIHVLRNT